HIFPIDEAPEGYDLLLGERKERYLGILIKYPEASEEKTKRQIIISSGSKITPKTAGTIGVGLIGAGNFARSYILPFISKRKDVRLVGISTSTGSSARNIADRYGFEFSTTDNKTIFDNEDIDLVIISTRHNTHAGLVIEALKREKAVYVEKPLAINEEELEQIVEIYNKMDAPFLHVGFNRRFSQLSNRLKGFISVKDAPFIINYRINAGTIPQTHWIKDPEVGGGRIIGEVCHFVDYMSFITGSIPEEVYAKCIDIRDIDNPSEDNISVTIKFKDGSVGNIIYTSIGDDAYPKEYIEIFGGKKVAIIEDFKSLTLSFKGKKKKHKLLSQDKGHANQINILVDALKKGTGAPIDFKSIYYTTLTTFRILDSLRTSKPIQVK
ncbi:MAG: oxidoreductase, partial [Candidatus Aenigmatarchaeota archaeon]